MAMDFRSDNILGCPPEITDALVRASRGTLSGYGRDEITERVRQRCCDLFETDVAIFPVLTGTAGNALAVATLTPPWGAVFCHADAHIQRDELGAVEFFSGGAKLIPIAGADGKLTPDALAAAIDEVANSSKTAVPACVSLTQVTEAGTVYRYDELRALCEVAQSKSIRIHIDGARFANAVVALEREGHSLADLTWRAGVDILTLGATKNGALGAEVIVVFRKELAEELALRYHRSGHRMSKMRLLSSQLEAYLADGLWLRNARHANAMAARLRDALASVPGVEILRPVEANILFVRFPPHVLEALDRAGLLAYDWPIFGPNVRRFVTGFSTTEADVDAVAAAMVGST